MTETKVVPFGKYKGQPVEVLAQDRGYMDWLSGQDWFRERYAGIYTLIVNNFTEPAETPDHNALQVMFLDDAFCERFVRVIRPELNDRLRSELDERRAGKLEDIEKKINETNDGLQRNILDAAEYDDYAAGRKICAYYKDNAKYWQDRRDYCRKYTVDYRAKLGELALQRAAWAVPLGAISLTFERHFEVRGVDVRLQLTAIDDQHKIRTTWPTRLIEIKPSVGDDYPAVLRQMRANGSEILFTERYTGVGATEEQFIKTFALSDIKVVFRCDVEAPE